MDRLHDLAYRVFDSGDPWPQNGRRLFDTLGISHITRAEIEWFGRAAFMSQCVQIRPEIILGLFATPDEITALDLSANDREYMNPAAFTRWTESRRTTRAAFEYEWKTRHRLPDRWCWSMALDAAMVTWPYAPMFDEELWTRFYMHTPVLSGRYGSIQIETEWSVSDESWSDCLARIIEAATAARDRTIKANDLIEIPEKLNDHVRWLAAHTAGHQTYADIAREEFTTAPIESARRRVGKGATEVAQLIGLTLPKD